MYYILREFVQRLFPKGRKLVCKYTNYGFRKPNNNSQIIEKNPVLQAKTECLGFF